MADPTSSDSPTDGYSKIDTIALPGGVGGHGDIVAYDADTQSVWLSQSPDNNVVVIDTTTNTVAATIPGIGNANGIDFSPQYAFVADVTNDSVDVINKNTYQVVDKVPVQGTTPDGVAYIPSTNQVTVASDDANTLGFFNAQAPFTETSTTQLVPNPSPPGPDVQLYVPSKDAIYQPDDQNIDVINPHTGQITKTFDVLAGSPASVNVKPMVYDPVSNDLIVGTTNNELLVVNANTGTVFSSIAIKGSVDEGVVDAATRTAFFAGSAGNVYAVSLNTDQLVGTIPTEVGTHTLTVDPTNNDLYVYEGDSNTVDVFAQNQVVCFASGTRLRAEIGDVAVEELRVGDRVVTRSGTYRTVRWIGSRTLMPGLCPEQRNVHPVRIRAGAFGAGLPEGDLRLSPGHPVLVGADDNGSGGHLVPVMCLVNGTTIERTQVESVTYWHVELDQHDILLAEGLPCESYIDLGSRPWFGGSDEPLHDPEFVSVNAHGRCRPVAIDGPVVEAERRRLDAVFLATLTLQSEWPTYAEDQLALRQQPACR